MTSVIIKIENYGTDKEEVIVSSICPRFSVHDVLLNRVEEFLSSYLGKNIIRNAIEEPGKRFGDVIIDNMTSGYIISVYNKKKVKVTIKEEGWIYSTEKEVEEEVEEKVTTKFYMCNYIENMDLSKDKTIPRAINYKEANKDIKVMNFNKVIEELKAFRPKLRSVSC